MKTLIAGFLLASAFIVHAGEPSLFFNEGFEDITDLAEWHTPVFDDPRIEECIAIKANSARSGKRGLFTVKRGIGKDLLLPAEAKELSDGFYFQGSFRFRPAVPVRAFDRSDTIHVIDFKLVNASDNKFYGSSVILTPGSGGRYFLSLALKAGLKEPETCFPKKPLFEMESNRWYSIALFIRLKEGVLSDTLYVDNKTVAAGAVVMKEKILLVRRWRAGLLSYSSTPLPCLLDMDDISLTSTRIASEKRAPLRPVSPFHLYLAPSQRGDKRFFTNETLRVNLEFEPLQSGYGMDCNFRSALYNGLKVDRFGVLDTTQNLVFSMEHSGLILFKNKTGAITWDTASRSERGQAYPYNTLFFENCAVQKDIGTAQFSVVLNKHLTSGAWSVNGHFLNFAASEITPFPSDSFQIIGIRASWHSNPLLFCSLLSAALFLSGVIVWRIRKKKVPDSIPDSWKNISSEVDKFLDENYSNPGLDSESIADKIGLSRQRLHTIYQSVTGKSPSQRLREIRIEKACELLKTTREAVSEIAFKTGFAEPNVFIRNFRKIIGKTPSQFR